MISGLDTAVFDGLDNLRILYLGDNQLKTFPSSMLSGLGKLNTMYDHLSQHVHSLWCLNHWKASFFIRTVQLRRVSSSMYSLCHGPS